MNSLFHLARHLGDLTAPGFQRLYYHRQLELLDHDTSILFDRRPPPTGRDDDLSDPNAPIIAHRAGTNCIAIDQTQGRYLISGGADTFIRLWDLEAQKAATDIDASNQLHSTNPSGHTTHHTISSISKATPPSHTHSITSLSIYPHDPTPQTLLTTSYDQSLLLTQITPTSLIPLHSFPLDFTVYTHSTSPHPSQPLVAVGTSNPSPRLIDLRSALATHSLPGHNGAIYSLAWHPKREHILVSSSIDGRILVFDIRRATPAFASFSLDDSLGISHSSNINLNHGNRRHLDFGHRAHEAPITGILFNEAGDKLISAAQDQRIRIWDVSSGKSDLVHFGNRIRNQSGREGENVPVLVPRGCAGGSGGRGGREVLMWANNSDDAVGKGMATGKGEIFMCEVREGALRRVLRTRQEKAREMVEPVGVNVGVDALRGRGVNRERGRRAGGTGRGAGVRPLGLNSRSNNAANSGRINALAFRPLLSDEGLGGPLEMYSAHGDGKICAWTTIASLPGADDVDEDPDEKEGSDDDNGDRKPKQTAEELAAEKSRKRKRELIEGLVEGLTKKPVTFS